MNEQCVRIILIEHSIYSLNELTTCQNMIQHSRLQKTDA